jgi:hypothetical protein
MVRDDFNHVFTHWYSTVLYLLLRPTPDDLHRNARTFSNANVAALHASAHEQYISPPTTATSRTYEHVPTACHSGDSTIDLIQPITRLCACEGHTFMQHMPATSKQGKAPAVVCASRNVQ